MKGKEIIFALSILALPAPTLAGTPKMMVEAQTSTTIRQQMYNPQNEMFSHFGTKRYNFKNETQLFKVIPHTSKIQKNRPASPERNTFEGS